MNWEDIFSKIQEKIKLGLEINTKNSTFRVIEEIPPYKCTSNGFNNEIGFKVRIGKYSTIEIPISMLKLLYTYSFNKNKRIYDSNIFKIHFPKQKDNHGCYVHSIGQIFVKSGIAKESGTKYEVF